VCQRTVFAPGFASTERVSQRVAGRSPIRQREFSPARRATVPPGVPALSLPNQTVSTGDGVDSFLDGDTLVCRLVPGSGVSRQLQGALNEIHRLRSHGLRHVLIDCVDLLTIDTMQLRAFGAVNDELRASGVQLLVLDARDSVLGRLAVCLPGATWIDSATGARSGAAATLCPDD